MYGIKNWFTLLFIAALGADEPYLANVEQVTFPSMGFERAGEGYFSFDGKKIAFQAIPIGEEHFQIYVMDLEEKKPVRVSSGKGACTCAYFHPNGKKILFASSHESEEQPEAQQSSQGSYKWSLTPYMNLYVANLDGTECMALTTGPAYHAECAYSHDGKRIVYASNEEGSMNLYIMDADGSNPYPITRTDSSYNGGPFFSPDGKKIVFRADRDEPDQLQIYTLTLESGEEQQLTNDGAVNWAPFWHPNGNSIAYTTSLHGHYQYEIYLLNIHTLQQCRITNSASFDGLPSFSPDGRKLLWTSKRAGGSCQLFIADFTLPEGF